MTILRATSRLWPGGLMLLLVLMTPVLSEAQICLTTREMDEPTRSALVTTGQRYFDFASRGDSQSLRQNAIDSVAADFSGIESAIKENQSAFSGAQAKVRPPFLLKAEGTEPLQRAEFLCGVFGSRGQTADSAVFVLPNLSPGNYGVVILDVSSAKGASTLSFVLQQQGNEWKLGGFFVKRSQVSSHDGDWFAARARDFKAKGQLHNAWLYLQQARELLSPVPFMSTMVTDQLYDEAQAVKPPGLPGNDPVDVSAGVRTFRLTGMFPIAVSDDLDVVVKYQATDVSDTARTFQDNVTVIKAVVAKYPELRDAFDGVVARAVEPSGRDYGSMLTMKDIK